MSIKTQAIALSTTPQRMGTLTSRRTYLEMYVEPGATAYVGGADVTTSTGIPYTSLDDNFVRYAWYEGDPTPGESYFVVGTSGTVRIIENPG